MQEEINVLDKIISSRRTVKPEAFNGEIIPDEHILKILESANWAPTHGLTEPWRCIVFSGREGVQQFGKLHASLYKQGTPKEQFLEKKYDTLLHKPDKASHVIIVVMKRGEKKNIPEIEEIAATACATQNMLLTAHAHAISAYWGTGGMCYEAITHQHFKLEPEDKIMGFLYLGYSDITSVEGYRNSTIQEKTTWVQ
jgi:nitroreductase